MRTGKPAWAKPGSKPRNTVSVQGGSESRTAELNISGLADGVNSPKVATIDASEDRRILGASITFMPNATPTNDLAAEVWGFIGGSNPFRETTASEDPVVAQDQNWGIKGSYVVQGENGTQMWHEPTVWYGSPGFEWNEDATLTFKAIERQGANLNDVSLLVWYDELG